MPDPVTIRPGQAVCDAAVDALTVGEVAMLAALYRLAARAAFADGDANLGAALWIEAAVLRNKLIEWAGRATKEAGQ